MQVLVAVGRICSWKDVVVRRKERKFVVGEWVPRVYLYGRGEYFLVGPAYQVSDSCWGHSRDIVLVPSPVSDFNVDVDDLF